MENAPIYNEPSFDYIIIKVSQGSVDGSNRYEATRKAWKAKLDNAKKYKYVLSVSGGIVMEVYEVTAWEVCKEEPSRIEFVGREAKADIAEQVKGKMIPEYYRAKGLASPFLYKKKMEGDSAEIIDDMAEEPAKATSAVNAELERLKAEAEKAKAELARIQAEAEAARAEAEKARAEAEKAKAEKTAAPTFKTVKIGSQVWTAENLALTKDRDGNELVLGKDYMIPGDDENYVGTYGLLYSRDAALRTIPKGWHLPTDGEWKQLERTIGLTDPDRKYDNGTERGKGIAPKLCAKIGWEDDARWDTTIKRTVIESRFSKFVEEHPEMNSTGFNVVPAGYAFVSNGHSSMFGETGYFLTASEDVYDEDGCVGMVYRAIRIGKMYGKDYCHLSRWVDNPRQKEIFCMSVRLVKDED